MKRLLTITVLLVATSCYAVDGKSLLIGISIGLGIYTYQGTRQHVVLPTVHAIQRTIRPLPQDKINKQQRKAAKRLKKARENEVRQARP